MVCPVWNFGTVQDGIRSRLRGHDGLRAVPSPELMPASGVEGLMSNGLMFWLAFCLALWSVFLFFCFFLKY